jgi:hypothetical protein
VATAREGTNVLAIYPEQGPKAIVLDLVNPTAA